MPLYEYSCQDCGSKFDALRSIKEADSAIECKHCHSHETHRKLSTFFAHSGGKAIAGGESHSCNGCSGGGACCGNCH